MIEKNVVEGSAVEAGIRLLRIAPLDGPPQAERLTPARPMVEVATRPDRWQGGP